MSFTIYVRYMQHISTFIVRSLNLSQYSMSATLSWKIMIWNNAFCNICDVRVICENYVNSDSEENLISPLVLISNISRLRGEKKKSLLKGSRLAPFYYRKLTLSINFWSFRVFSSRNFSLSCWAFICFSSCFFLDSAIVLLIKNKAEQKQVRQH